MKKYKFELQDVLDYRNLELEQAQVVLGKALAVENEIKQNLEIIAQQYASIKQMMKGSKSFEDIVSQNQHNKLLEYQKEELLKQLAEAKLVTEEKRKILQEILKKTTALEKLKERMTEEYVEEQKKLQQKEADDINSRRRVK